MKKIFSFITIAAFIAAGIVSCDKVVEESVTPGVEEETGLNENAESSVPYLTFALSDGESTKAVLGESAGKKFAQWEDGDKIGSITTKSQGYSSVDASSTPVVFNVYSSGGLSEGNTINLWYPYSTKQTNAAAVALSIPATQNQVGGVFDYSAMPMVAEQITVTAGMVSATDNTPVDVVGFYNLGSLIDFKIFANSSYTSEKVLSVTFNASAPIAGDFTKDLTAVNASDESTLTIDGYTETSVTTNVMPFTTVGTSKETPLDVYMVVAPGTYTGTVVVVTDAATYTWTISSGKEFKRSSVKPLGLQLDKASATRVAHVKGSFSWDLSKESWDSLDDNDATWSHGILTLDAAKGTGTKLTNYTPPTNASTRFYKNNTLNFTVGVLQIEKVEFTATTDGYATAMASSDWTNAIGSASGTTATITPIDGSDDFMATIGAPTGNTRIKVYYDNNTYTIYGASSPIAGGSFTIKKGASDVTSAKVNTTITLAYTPNPGYAFSSWTVKDAENNDITVSGSNEFQMPASNVTVTANFVDAGVTYSVSFADYSHGTASASPSSSIAAGETVTITATPDAGYTLYSLTAVDAGSNNVTISPSKTFTMPSSNVTVTPVFKTYAPWTATSGAMGSEVIASVNGTTSDTVTTTAAGTTPSYTWSWTRTLKSLKTGKSDYIGWSSTDGIQLGSSNSDEEVVFTTSGITGTIKKIIVTCRGDNHRVSATVDGTSYISATDMTNSSAEYSGTGSSSGEIVITITPKSTSTYKACYIKKIEVIYE